MILGHFQVTLLLLKVQIIMRSILTSQKCMCLFSHNQYALLPTQSSHVFSVLYPWTPDQPTRMKRKTPADYDRFMLIYSYTRSAMTKVHVNKDLICEILSISPKGIKYFT